MKKASNKIVVSPKSQKVNGLYQGGNNFTRRSKSPPVYYSVQDTAKAQTQYDRLEQIRLARYLFSRCPDLGGAVMQKSSWVVGPGSFKPIFHTADTVWNDLAEDFLITQFYPNCSPRGANYNFTTILNQTSMALDIDGDTGCLLTYTENGFPQIDLVAAHRIGQRKATEKVITKGVFEGFDICDGVITKNNKPYGYRLLGDKIDGSEDIDIASKSFQLLFEPEWSDQQRGISRIARSITDWQNQDDINEFLLQAVKFASSIALKHKTESGDASGSGFDPGQSEDTACLNSGVTVTPINGGEMVFLKAGTGEDIETIENKNPSPETEAFIERIQKRALFSIGWQQEMLDASKVGGASVRLIQDLARRSVSTRQETIERRAKFIVAYAIANAIKIGILPPNKEWFKFSFTKGASITVDAGNENKSDIENYKMGTVTLSDICAKRGQDWYEVRNQTQREVEDLLTRAQALSDKTGKPFELCLLLMQQNTPNQTASASEPVPPLEAAPTKDKKK